MTIGGKFYISNLAASAKRFNYGKQMNRQVVEDNIASAQSLGGSLFTIKSSASEDMVSQTFQQVVERMQAEYEDRKKQILDEAEKSGLFA